MINYIYKKWGQPNKTIVKDAGPEQVYACETHILRFMRKILYYSHNFKYLLIVSKIRRLLITMHLIELVEHRNTSIIQDCAQSQKDAIIVHFNSTS